MKSALKLVGYIVAFLLMAAGLIAIVLYMMGLAGGEESLITTMPPVVSETPAVSDDANQQVQDVTPEPFIPTPSPTAEPTPTPTVTPSPTPAPTPTPIPEPVGTPLGSGKFSSDTGVWIDIDALWNAETVDNDLAKVTVTVDLRSYRLQTANGAKALKIVLEDQSVVLDVEPLVIETQEEVTTEIGTHTFTVTAPKGQNTTLDLKVSWYFGGTYSGQQLDYVEAGGFVTLLR